MNAPSLPTGYDVSYHALAGRSDCHLTVGIDRERGHVPRFLLQLLYQVQAPDEPVDWQAIARMDHNETSEMGHDIYREGLHVDVARRSSATVHLEIPHGSLPTSRDTVVRRCAEYLAREASYFVGIYEERLSPGAPPRWSSDGGDSATMFINRHWVEEGMGEESPIENALTLRELSERLAEIEGTTPEEIERGAAELDLAPPWEAEIVEE